MNRVEQWMSETTVTIPLDDCNQYQRQRNKNTKEKKTVKPQRKTVKTQRSWFYTHKLSKIFLYCILSFNEIDLLK